LRKRNLHPHSAPADGFPILGRGASPLVQSPSYCKHKSVTGRCPPARGLSASRRSGHAVTLLKLSGAPRTLGSRVHRQPMLLTAWILPPSRPRGEVRREPPGLPPAVGKGMDRQPAFRALSGSIYPPSTYRGLPVHGRNFLTAKRAPGCSTQMDSSRWLTVIVPSWKA
jgi:hypothetical protein